MSVEYVSNGEVDLAGLCFSIGGARDRLLAVISEVSGDEEGAVVNEVTDYLGALHDDLDKWLDSKWPDVWIVPNLFLKIRRHIRRHLDESPIPRGAMPHFEIDGSCDVDIILRALVATLLYDALGTRLDLKAMHERFIALLSDNAKDNPPKRQIGFADLTDCPVGLKPVLRAAMKMYPDLLDWLVIKGGLDSRTGSLGSLTLRILTDAVYRASEAPGVPPAEEFVAGVAALVGTDLGPTADQGDRPAKAPRPTAPRKMTARRNGRKRTAARR